MREASNFKDLTGHKFSRLTVLSLDGKRGFPRQSFWLCRCDCGAKKVIARSHLQSGSTQSCGCLKSERSSEYNGTHRMTKSKTYKTWISMRWRCEKQDCEQFKHYGGRGIKVCGRWLSFENFIADMGERPDGMSIERKDTNGDYTPENCKWATAKEQCNNRRNNTVIKIGDISKTLKQWCEHFSTPYKRVHLRIRNGWEPLTALTKQSSR